MIGYTKLFSTLLVSTVWGLSKEARILWITMLVLKDKNQVVQASIPGLAHTARLEVQETEAALKELERPDPYSQSKEREGRRIVRVESGGWFIVNGEKYRDMLSLEERREYKARWAANARAKKKAGGTTAKEDEPIGSSFAERQNEREINCAHEWTKAGKCKVCHGRRVDHVL